MKTQHRIVQNDPEYDRITGLRKAREHRFNAKVLAVIGAPFLLVGALLGIVARQGSDMNVVAAGAGVIGIGCVVLAFLFFVNAWALEEKFRE